MNSSTYMILGIALFFVVPLAIVLIRRNIIKRSIKIGMSANPGFIRRNGTTVLTLKLETGYNLTIKDLRALLVCIEKVDPGKKKKRCVEEIFNIEDQISLVRNEYSVFEKQMKAPHYLGEESGKKIFDGKTRTHEWFIEVKMNTEVGEVRDSIPIRIKGNI